MRFSKNSRDMSDVNNQYICQDIWFEIFKELPVKTIGICRCVCKSWYSLVVSPSFMAAHLKHYTQNDANSLLLYKEISECSSIIGVRRYEQCVLFRDSSQLKQGNRLYTSVCPFVVPNSWFSMYSFYFVGSVNGLLCVSDDMCLRPGDRILIWNPLLEKFVKLPLSSSTAKSSVVGFGYDFLKNDHRVIKISSSYRNKPFVEVYSVQERTWRTICSKYLVDNSIDRVSPSHCFLNGIIHWDTRNKWLLLFNVTDETFAKMELPEIFLNNYSNYVPDFGVFEYQGKLSVSHCDYSLGRRILVACKVWVKQDYNVGNSWCEILSIEMLHNFYHFGPLEYLGENEELIGFSNEWIGEVVSYDPKTKQRTELGHRNSKSTTFSAYSPSLALLDLKIDDLTADEFEWYCPNTEI